MSSHSAKPRDRRSLRREDTWRIVARLSIYLLIIVGIATAIFWAIAWLQKGPPVDPSYLRTRFQERPVADFKKAITPLKRPLLGLAGMNLLSAEPTMDFPAELPGIK